MQVTASPANTTADPPEPDFTSPPETLRALATHGKCQMAASSSRRHSAWSAVRLKSMWPFRGMNADTGCRLARTATSADECGPAAHAKARLNMSAERNNGARSWNRSWTDTPPADDCHSGISGHTGSGQSSIGKGITRDTSSPRRLAASRQSFESEISETTGPGSNDFSRAAAAKSFAIPTAWAR